MLRPALIASVREQTISTKMEGRLHVFTPVRMALVLDGPGAFFCADAIQSNGIGEIDKARQIAATGIVGSLALNELQAFDVSLFVAPQPFGRNKARPLVGIADREGLMMATRSKHDHKNVGCHRLVLPMSGESVLATISGCPPKSTRAALIACFTAIQVHHMDGVQ